MFGLFLLLLFIGTITGGIGFFIIYILCELAHINQYALALGFLLMSVVELLRFILYITMDKEIKLNPKELWNKVKLLFKKRKNKEQKIDKKDENLKELEKVVGKTKKRSNVIFIVEIVVLVLFAIYSVVSGSHSIVLKFTYHNVFIRLMVGILIPLIIINIVNSIRSEGFDSYPFWTILFEFIVVICITATFVFSASASEKDHPAVMNFLKDTFVYDNDSYDEARKDADFSDVKTFIKDSLINSLEELEKTYDINKEADYYRIKSALLDGVEFTKYGLNLKNHLWEDDDNLVLYILDKKKNDYYYFKFNPKTREFISLNQNEYKEIVDSKKK